MDDHQNNNNPYPYQQPQNTQYPYTAPQKTSGEFVVGINVISKIGVVFIIIGIIAFSIVAAPILNGIALSLIIYAAGIVLGAAGEFFYRRGNKIFSRALTLGCIAELFITTLISSLKLSSFAPIVEVLISAVIAAGGILLSIRCKSQTVLAVTAVGGMLMTFVGDHSVSCCIALMLYLLILQAAITVLSVRKNYIIPPVLALTFNIIVPEVLNSRLDAKSGSDFTAFWLVIGYILLSFSVYTAASLICEFRGISVKKEIPCTLLISSTFLMTIFVIVLFWSKFSPETAGAAALVLTVIYIILALISHMNSPESLVTSTLKVICVALLITTDYTLLVGRYAYIAAHIIGAALFVFGILKSSKLFRNCGIAILILSELNFWLISLIWSSEPIYYVQYSLNIAIWLGIMILLTLRGYSGKLMNAYIITVYSVCSFYVIFLISRLFDKLHSIGVLNAAARDCSKHYYAAVIFMLLAFLIAKRKSLGKATVVTSEIIHISALAYLGVINLCLSFSDLTKSSGLQVSIPCVIACTASVFAALDLALNIQRQCPKFSKAVGLIISGYAVITATYLLSVNNIVAFTSCIISAIYILLSTAWIIIGFKKENPLLRRFGLALVLFSCAKLFLFDFSNIDNIGRTVMFIGFGIALLCISMIYGFFEAKMKKK